MTETYENLQAMTNNLNLAFCVSQAKYLGEKGQTLEEQRLILTRLLFCLNQPNVTFNPKQAEDLFFSVTKTFQSPSQHVHALAAQVIARLSPHVRSAFFATRSLVQVFEKEPQLQPAALRVLGLTANQNSLADVQKLVRLATLDNKNARLAASGGVAAKAQNIPLDAALVEKHLSPAGFCIAECVVLEKLIQSAGKSGNVYAGISALRRISESSNLEERKKFSVYLQFMPATAKDAMFEKLPLYLTALQAISRLSFAAIKPQLNALFTAFGFAFSKAEMDHEKIALLRQALKIYAAAVNNQASIQDLTPLNSLLLQLQNASNQTIQTLATIHLITSTKDPNTIIRLSVLLPGLTGELKKSALDLLSALTAQPSVYSFLIPILLDFLHSQDAEIRRVGFASVSEIVHRTEDSLLKAKLTGQLIENFDDAADPEMSRQLCAQLAQVECQDEGDAKRMAAGLWQRSLLDNVQVRLASVQALARLAKQYASIKPILQQAVDVQQDRFVQEAVIEREENNVPNFNFEDIIAAAPALLSGQAKSIEFKLKKQTALDQPKTSAQKESELIKLNKNYKKFPQTFTNGQFQTISGVNDDVTVEVCKVFYFYGEQDSKVQVMFAFRVSCDEGLRLENVELSVAKKTYSGTSIQIIQDFDNIQEAQLQKLSLQYVLDGEEDEIRLEDVMVDTYDLVEDTFIANYEKLFESFPENLQKYTLAEMGSIDEVVDALPNNTGLRLEELQIDGKRATFWLLGTVLGFGDAIVHAEAKVLKAGGVGVKLDFRGPAGAQIQGFFE